MAETMSAICRCCHAEGEFKSLQQEYTHKTEKEIYSTMLRDTLGLTITDNHSICDDCIVELRAAARFKQQVEACERKFHDEYGPSNIKEEPADDVDMKVEDVKLQVSVETQTDPTQDMRPGYRRPFGWRPHWNNRVHFYPNRTRPGFIARKKPFFNNPETHKIYTCEKCSKELVGFANYKRHLNEHDTASENGQITNDSAVTENVNTDQENIGTEQKIFQCSKCNYKFLTANGLAYHEKSKHSDPDIITINSGVSIRERGVYPCTKCNYKFTTIRGLNYHLRIKHDILKERAIYQCNKCTYKFNTSRGLAYHDKTKHQLLNSRISKERVIYPCTKCNYKFISAIGLSYHEKNRHLNPPRCLNKCASCSCGNNVPSNVAVKIEPNVD